MESKIKSITSPLPDNMRKVEVLELEEGCTAGEAFHLMMNYPKLKAFKIAGVEYKRAQIGKLSSGDRLGGSGRRSEISFDIEWLTGGATPPTQPRRHFEALRAENNRRRQVDAARSDLERIINNPIPPVWYTDEPARETTAAERMIQEAVTAAPTVRTTYQTDEYRQLMERLMAENPAWNDIGDTPITPQRRETAGLANAQTAQPTPAQLQNLFMDPPPVIGGQWMINEDLNTPAPTPEEEDGLASGPSHDAPYGITPF